MEWIWLGAIVLVGGLVALVVVATIVAFTAPPKR